MNRALTGMDVDTEATIAELERLVAALKNGDAYMQELHHTENTVVEDAATERVELSYTLSEDFEGIDPIQYETERQDGGDA